MNLHEKQQFDFLLMTAAERFADRIVQRCAGQDNALAKLKGDRDADGIWLTEFVDNIFEDFLLDNTAGACFVLAALEKRQIDFSTSGKIGDSLLAMAKNAFGDLLYMKIVDSMERAIAVGA